MSRKQIIKLSFIFLFVTLATNFFVNQFLHLLFDIKRSVLLNIDFLGDIVKVAISYRFFPLENLETYPDFIQDYWFNNPYKGLAGLMNGELTNLSATPLGIISSFFTAYLFNFIGIFETVIFFVIASIFSFYLLINRISIEKKYIFIFLASFIISYPFLFLLQRGNFFAFLSFIFLAFALILSQQKNTNFWLLSIFFAISVLYRPNIILFAPFFLFGQQTFCFNAFKLMFTFIIITILSFYIANAIYLDYNFLTFLDGLKIYNKLYVLGDDGYAYSISFLSLLKSLNKFFVLNIPISLLLSFNYCLALIFFTLTFLLRYKKIIGDYVFLFLLVSLNALLTPVFADYHLVLFFIPIIYYLNQKNYKNKDNFYIYIICICLFSMSPMNYLFENNCYLISHLKTIFLSFFLLLIYWKTLVSRVRLI
jgi:hypothetical protein